MLKRLTVAAAALFALAMPALAAGNLPGFSLTPQFDLTGKVAPGCRLYTISAGTVSTPQTAYSDSGLTIALPNPLLCDASGRLPQWFVADGSIKVRLTKSDGTQIFVGDNLLVIGASSGGGGGSPVDPTTIIATGYVQAKYGTGTLSGFVRMNGRTIGSATSGAGERANSDTQALFEYLWSADTTLAVSGGRGVSANADWVANKTLTLPDMRGRLLAGLSAMGASTCGVNCITSTTLANPDQLGFAGGTDTKTVLQVNLPNVNFTGSGSTYNPGTLSTNQTTVFSPNLSNAAVTGGSGTIFAPAPSIAALTVNVPSYTPSVTVNSGGSGTAMSVLPPVLPMTIYIKL